MMKGYEFKINNGYLSVAFIVLVSSSCVPPSPAYRPIINVTTDSSSEQISSEDTASNPQNRGKPRIRVMWYSDTQKKEKHHYLALLNETAEAKHISKIIMNRCFVFTRKKGNAPYLLLPGLMTVIRLDQFEFTEAETCEWGASLENKDAALREIVLRSIPTDVQLLPGGGKPPLETYPRSIYPKSLTGRWFDGAENRDIWNWTTDDK